MPQEAGVSEIDQVRDDLDAALADLIASVEGMTPEVFERAVAGDSPRDRLWRAGLVEDWTRRAVDQGVSGREVDAFHDRERPAIAQTAEYLVMWLEQCRRPMLALLRRLPDDALDREFALALGERTTARGLLAALAEGQSADAVWIRSQRADVPPVQRDGVVGP